MIMARCLNISLLCDLPSALFIIACRTGVFPALNYSERMSLPCPDAHTSRPRLDHLFTPKRASGLSYIISSPELF